METTYRGFTIKYDKDTKSFKTDSEDYGTLSHADLAGLERAIDRKLDEPEERAKKQPQQKAFTLHARHGKARELTSYTLGAFGNVVRYGSATLHVWAWTKMGRWGDRSRHALRSYCAKFYQDTPENRAIAEEIVKKSAELAAYIEAEEKAITKMEEKLTEAKPAIPADQLPQWDK